MESHDGCCEAADFPLQASVVSRMVIGALLPLLSFSVPQPLNAQEDANRGEAYAEALRYTFQWLERRDVLPEVRQFKFDPSPRGRYQMSPGVATTVMEKLGLSPGQCEIICPDDQDEKFEEGCRLPDGEKGFISADLESLQRDTAIIATQIYHASEFGGQVAFMGLTVKLERSEPEEAWVVRELLGRDHGIY